MFSAAVSITLASTFAFSPYAVGRMSARIAPPATTTAPEPTDPTAPAPAPTEPAPSGWDDEPIADPPAPAPAPAPVAEPLEPTGPETHEVTRPRTHPGIGLIVGASVAGAGAWGLAIGKILLAKRCNDSIDSTSTTGEAEATVFQCFTSIRSILGLSIAGWFVNWATWGLAAGAGAVRGKHDGVGYAWDGKPNRSGGGFIGGGAAMLGVGVLGIGLTRVFALTSILQCPVDSEVNHCITRRFQGYFAGVQISSSIVAAGLGMMIYGIMYRKNRNQFENRRRVTGLQVVPDVSLFRGSGGGYNGLAVTGRF